MPSIAIFNLTPITQFDPDEIRAAVTESNFHTLCDQYCLDPALIQPALDSLEIQVPDLEKVPLFGLRFAPEPTAPIIVNCWRESERVAAYIHTYTSVAPALVQNHLSLSKEVFIVELQRLQSADLGVLFAYELARWLAFRGGGWVYGFDGTWYRLNAHKAFLPVIQQ